MKLSTTSCQPIHTVKMPVKTVISEWANSIDALHFKTLTVAQLFMKYCASLMESESSLPCSQNGTYNARDETVHTLTRYTFKISFNIIPSTSKSTNKSLTIFVECILLCFTITNYDIFTVNITI
jgi:hypothetical protein